MLSSLRDGEIKEGTFVSVVIGGDYNGYYSNMARTIFVGKPEGMSLNALKCMDEVYESAYRATRADVMFIDVMRELDKVYSKIQSIGKSNNRLFSWRWAAD